MPTLAASHIPAPTSWSEFEDIVLSVAKIRWKGCNFTGHGRQGQKQDGVDIYGRDEQRRYVGIQCKNTVDGFTADLIEIEVKSAKKFRPKLSFLFLATTARRDSKLQKLARRISRRQQKAGSFEVELLFWADVCNDLTSDDDRFYQHYPQFKPKNSSTQAPSHDQKLFEEFQKVLPFAPAIELLQKHDFGGPFRRSAIQPLFDFVETWDSVEKEFKDREIEQRRVALYKAALEMSTELVEKTVPIGNQQFASVLSDALRAQGGPRPDWVQEEARVLNNAATKFVPVYEKFVRYCRDKLIP